MSCPPKVVLVEPLIPQNTGSIARLTAANNTELHLIKPLGFELSDKYLKRAGLDYWPETNITVHDDWQSFLTVSGAQEEQLWLLTTKGQEGYHSMKYKAGDYLVFGNESKGLPESIHMRYPQRRIRIPMENPNVRSLNLSNATSIVLYEARRQLGLLG